MDLDLNDIPIERALGIIWNPQEGKLQTKIINKDCKLLLSYNYYPIRMISSLILEPKLIIQENLEEKCSMEQTATPGYKTKMGFLEKNIPSLAKTKISRWHWFTAPDIRQLELHVFADASKCAYGAVADLRHIY